MRRGAGILMHISSLPSPYGIGTLGRSAYEFADFLRSAGQSYWQMLPVGHTGYADSPYQVFSTYAGNPYFIDIETLKNDGLLDESDLNRYEWGLLNSQVDYGSIYKYRYDVLKKAYDNGKACLSGELLRFTANQAGWIHDYALFMAIKRHFNMIAFSLWPDESIRLRKPEAIEHYSELLREDIDLFIFIQYLFFKQWGKLREYTSSLGISLIGDLPIYVSPDSADVWANPDNFLLDENERPLKLAGVPPDYFCQTGQLWGNPIYDWAELEKNGYSFWIKRVNAASRLFDIIRIDHFRGFESYWSVPAGEITAEKGEWVKGPGIGLIQALKANCPDANFIAEDLGENTPGLAQFVIDTGLPNMKVLQFAFDGNPDNIHLPHTYSHSCVCYTGTHDNTTAADWFASINQYERQRVTEYIGMSENSSPAWELIRLGMSSVADIFIAQMQDYLELPASCRTNTPGTHCGNWRWRMCENEITGELAEKIGALTRMYGRC